MPDSRHDANEWWVPGRPTHPDFLRLADLVLRSDAESDSGDAASYTRSVLGQNYSAVTSAAVHEARKIDGLAAGKSFESAAQAAWITGFTAGLRVVRGAQMHQNKPLTREEMKAIVYLGVDVDSVEWMASQRAMRIVQAFGKTPEPRVRVAALASAWMDAVIVGYQFDDSGSARRG